MRLCTIAVCVWACIAALPVARGQDPNQIDLERKKKIAAESDRVRTLMNDPRLDVIRNKISFGGAADATLPMMALQSRPSANEQPAIELWQNLRRDSRTRFNAIYRQYTPEVIPFVDSEAAAVFSLVADLYTGKLTYGDFNRQRLDVHNRTREAAREYYADIRKQRQANAERQQAANQQQQLRYEQEVRRQQVTSQQARDAEIARQQQVAQQIQAQRNFERAMALAKLQTYLQQMRLINQQYQPARIAPFSCTRIGNMVDCY